MWKKSLYRIEDLYRRLSFVLIRKREELVHEDFNYR